MMKALTKKKSILAAGAIVASLVAFQPAPATADVQFYFGFNGPAYQGQSYSNRGWNRGHGRYQTQRISCRQARRILRNHYGFRRIRALECNGNRYTFRARRDGDRWKIKVNAYTGEVIRMRRT